jgi:autotransporter family porin
MKLVNNMQVRVTGWLLGSTLLLASNPVAAVIYNYPTAGGGTLAVAPLALANTTDTLNVNSGTFATPSSSSVVYTVDSSLATTTGTTINVASGATLGYLGSNSGGAAINSNRSDPNATTSTINISGNVNCGPGLYGINLTNSNGGSLDTYTINLNANSSVTGAILTNGIKNLTLNLYDNVTVNGTINLQTNGTLSLLNMNSGTFTQTYALNNIGTMIIHSGSTFNLNTTTSNINQVVVLLGGTLNVNSQLNGISVSDGGISNNGTMNITTNIAKTGQFSGSGTNNISGGANGAPITVSTSTYAMTTHQAVLNDILDYGYMSLTSATLNVQFFNATYPSNGYFPAGTYTLLNSTSPPTIGFTNKPSDTMFLSFGSPTINGNQVRMTITRTPYTQYTTSALTTSIASNLETLGANNPSSDMVTLLNALESSTTQSGLNSALQELAPLISAPIYGFEVQNNSMYQAQLRLAELRDDSSSYIGSYIAGDIAHDTNIWLRPFGSYANQQPIDESFGYYGSSGGIAVGLDRQLDFHYTVGAGFAYVLSHIQDKVNQDSETKVKSYIGIVYGSYNSTETNYLDWLVAVTANNFDANRYISINSNYNQTALSSYGSQQIAAKFIWGKNLSAFNFMQFNPELFTQYTFAKQYTYSESGATGANLQISRSNANILQVGVGCKASTPVLVNPGIIVPEIHASAYYNPLNSTQNTYFNFIQGGSQMTTFMNLSRTGLRVGGALTIAVMDKMQVKANFDYDIADRYNGYTVYLNLRYLL